MSSDMDHILPDYCYGSYGRVTASGPTWQTSLNNWHNNAVYDSLLEIAGQWFFWKQNFFLGKLLIFMKFFENIFSSGSYALNLAFWKNFTNLPISRDICLNRFLYKIKWKFLENWAMGFWCYVKTKCIPYYISTTSRAEARQGPLSNFIYSSTVLCSLRVQTWYIIFKLLNCPWDESWMRPINPILWILDYGWIRQGVSLSAGTSAGGAGPNVVSRML